MAFSLFRRKAEPVTPYDRNQLTPAIRCSICTGEKVAGFRRKDTGAFEDRMLIRDEADLQAFREQYGIQGEIERIY